MKQIEFVDEDGLFRAEYDSRRDQPSLAVVAMVAAADNSDPGELPPLHSAVDTGALDDLFSETTTGGRRTGSISFPYEGFDVTVSSEGVITANPMENVSSKS